MVKDGGQSALAIDVFGLSLRPCPRTNGPNGRWQDQIWGQEGQGGISFSRSDIRLGYRDGISREGL